MRTHRWPYEPCLVNEDMKRIMHQHCHRTQPPPIPPQWHWYSPTSDAFTTTASTTIKDTTTGTFPPLMPPHCRLHHHPRFHHHGRFHHQTKWQTNLKLDFISAFDVFKFFDGNRGQILEGIFVFLTQNGRNLKRQKNRSNIGEHLRLPHPIWPKPEDKRTLTNKEKTKDKNLKKQKRQNVIKEERQKSKIWQNWRKDRLKSDKTEKGKD